MGLNVIGQILYCVMLWRLPVHSLRPVREDPLNAERETTEKEENNDKEKHSEPVLQRVFQLRGVVWTDRCELVG